MRLIDADDFMEYLGFDNTDEEREENVGQIVTLEDFDRQETAYDVEKVIEQLERLRNFHYKEMKKVNAYSGDVFDHHHDMAMAFNKAVDIVKSGGVAND